MRMYRAAHRTYEGARAEDLAHPSVIEFLAVHDMFKRELARLVEFVEQVMAAESSAPGEDEGSNADNERKALHAEIARYVAMLAEAFYQYTTYLHGHHSGETLAIFPALQPLGLEEAVVARLNREHDELAELLDQLDARLDAPGAAIDDGTLRDLGRLAELLRTHLDYEETHVCPLLPKLGGWPAGLQDAWAESHRRQRSR